MGLFSGLASIVTSPLSILHDTFIEGETPVQALKNAGSDADRAFKR